VCWTKSLCLVILWLVQLIIQQGTTARCCGEVTLQRDSVYRLVASRYSRQKQEQWWSSGLLLKALRDSRYIIDGPVVSKLMDILVDELGANTLKSELGRFKNTPALPNTAIVNTAVFPGLAECLLHVPLDVRLKALQDLNFVLLRNTHVNSHAILSQPDWLDWFVPILLSGVGLQHEEEDNSPPPVVDAESFPPPRKDSRQKESRRNATLQLAMNILVCLLYHYMLSRDLQPEPDEAEPLSVHPMIPSIYALLGDKNPATGQPVEREKPPPERLPPPAVPAQEPLDQINEEPVEERQSLRSLLFQVMDKLEKALNGPSPLTLSLARLALSSMLCKITSNCGTDFKQDVTSIAWVGMFEVLEVAEDFVFYNNLHTLQDNKGVTLPQIIEEDAVGVRERHFNPLNFGVNLNNEGTCEEQALVSRVFTLLMRLSTADFSAYHELEDRALAEHVQERTSEELALWRDTLAYLKTSDDEVLQSSGISSSGGVKFYAAGAAERAQNSGRAATTAVYEELRPMTEDQLSEEEKSQAEAMLAALSDSLEGGDAENPDTLRERLGLHLATRNLLRFGKNPKKRTKRKRLPINITLASAKEVERHLYEKIRLQRAVLFSKHS
jgi:hypothetical protein